MIREVLFVGLEIEKDKLQQLKESAAKTILQMKLTEYSFRMRYSARELKQKLKIYSMKKFGFELSQKDFDAKLAELEKTGFYNEENIIKNFIESYIQKKKGKRFIQSKLIGKGFDKEKIEKLLNSKDDEELTEQLKIFLEKKKESISKKAKDRYDLRQKLVKAAMGRGYDYGIIKKVIDEI